ASYGTPTGSCPSFATSACHASSSKSNVESRCLNQQSCSVGANNGVFGDPCSGQPKKLAVVYTCSGGTSSGAITHVGTTQVWDRDGTDLSIARPSGSTAGDLLVLFLHRTDNYLPVRVNGWTRVAECYKRDNAYDCSTVADCTNWNANPDYCERFGDSGRRGQDLAQAAFYRVVGSGEASSYQFTFINKIEDGKELKDPAWAILTALRGAATSNPVRDWDNEGNDHNSDSLFPSVYGEKGDMLLLSQSYDDVVAKEKFGAPDGTSTFGYVSQSDEAGFLFGGILTSAGETGAKKTHGDGGYSDKDALVSLTIKPH
ncbi:MAG: SUEL-type lectin domain-containing protein, partial [Myxococcota bacterium]|nr:SUEL-type lectin domain-containing protein [Myxococcota bacterium]